MRILVLFRDAYRIKNTSYRWIVPGLEAAGHEVVPLDPMLMAELAGWDAGQRHVRRWLKVWRPQLVIAFPPYHSVDRETVLAGQTLGTRWVALRYDDPIWLGYAQALDRAASPDELPAGHLGPAWLSGDNDLWDLTLTTSRQAARLFAERGEPVQYARLPIAHESYRLEPGKVRPTISFVGGYQPDNPGRTVLLLTLAAAGLPLEVWGPGWQGVPEMQAVWRGHASHEALCRTMGRTVASISMTGLGGPQAIPMLKLRMLEVAACGGMPVVDACEEVAEYLTPGEEVLTYTDAPDLVRTLQGVLARPERGREIARRAQARVLRECGWQPWLNDVVRRLETLGRPIDFQQQNGDAFERPVLGESLVALANLLENKQDPELALPLYRQAAKLLPTDSGALAGIARTAPQADEQREAFAVQVRHASPRTFVSPKLSLTDLPASGLHPAAPGVEAIKRLIVAGDAGDAGLWRQGARLLLHLDADLTLYCLTKLLEHGEARGVRDRLLVWRQLWGETPNWQRIWQQVGIAGPRP